jgi:biotin operon repressor
MTTRTRHSYEEMQTLFEGIVKGYRSGKTIKEIAKQLKIKESAVTNYALQLRKAGVPIPRASRTNATKGNLKKAIHDFAQKYRKSPKKESTPVQLSLFGNVTSTNDNLPRKLEVKSV